MPDNKDKIKVLYDAVSSDYNVGTLDEFKSKLADSNKRKAFYDAIGSEYNLGSLDDFNKKIDSSLASIYGPVGPTGTSMKKGELPSFQEQVETLQTVQSKYDKAVNDDRSELGKTLSSLYNGIVGSAEKLAKFAVGLPAQFPVTPYQFSPVDIGKSAESARKFAELPIEERLKPVKESQKGIEEAFDVVRSGYTTREDEKQIAGQFNVFDGIGLKDVQALVAMSGGMAADMALGAFTGGTTFVAQGMQMAFEDYDEAVEKAGIKPDANARGLYGLAGGVINGLLEKFAVDKLVGDTPVFRDLQRRAITNVLKNTANMPLDKAANVIQKAAVEEIKRLTSTIKSKGIRALYRAGVEGGTESAQAALEDGAKFAANLVQGNEAFNEEAIREGFLQNVVNSGIAGGIFGPVFGAGADVAFGRNVNTQLLKDISDADTPEALARIEQELSETFDKNNFSQEERDAIMANANRYAQIKQTIPEGTTPQAQATAIPLIESRIKIDNEIESRRNALQSLDEALVPDEEYSISLLEDKRSQINDDIREVINGEKYNYFEQDGKYFKQLGENAPEEITKNRFELQKIKEDATKTSEVQEGLTAGDISQREGTQETETQEETAETDIGYSYIVGEEGDEIPVAALLNKKVRVNGQPAILYQQGQTVEARIIGTNRIIEIGNVNKLMNELPEAYNIELDEVLVTETPQGYRIEGQSLQNTNENPLDAISFDSNGNVMNVVLTTPAGKRRKFRGQVAKDLAYQIQLKEILKDEQEFENFLEREHQQELENARLQAVAEEQAAGDTEAVPTVEAEPTPAAAVVPVEPRYGRVTVDKPVTGIRGPRLKRKAVNDANRVVASIRSVVSKMTGRMPEINLHDQATFEEAVVAAGASREDATARGFYLGTDGTIHINLDNVASDTVLHEGFHPILDFLQSRNPEVINKYFAELEAIPEAAPFIKDAIDNYIGDVTQKKEAITSFVAAIANGDVIINPSNFQKIRKFVLDLLNALGMGVDSPKLMNVKTPGELVELADYVTEMFREGGDVFGIALEIDRIREARRVESLEQGLVMAAGEMTPERIEESKVGNTNPIQFSRPEKFKEVELVSLPTKSMLDAYNEFGGKAVAINSDPTRVGNLTLPSGKEIFMYGGLNYTALKPNVDGEIGFASTRISKPEQVARLMNTLFQDNNGEGLVLVAAQKPDSMLGNAYSLEYTLDAVSQLPKKILRSSEFKDEFFGKDIVAIKEAFGEKEYAEFVKKFRGADLSNPEIMNTMIETLLTDIGNNFIARNSLVGNMLAGVVEKSSRAATKGQPGYVSVTPNKFIAKSLFDRFGLNQEKLFYEIGEKGIVDEYMNNGNWGFVTTGFTLDGKIDPKSIQDKGVIHPQFNAKFHGKNPFILDGAYLIDKLFPPEEITAKTGKPYVKKASLMVAGSMYPKGAIQPVAAPDTKGVPQFQKSVPTKPVKGVVRKTLKDAFNSFGLLGKDVKILQEKMSGELTAEVNKAEAVSKKAIDLAKKYKGVVSNEDMEKVMTGQAPANTLPTDLANALNDAREHIDNMTERLIELGVIDSQESIDYYRQNKGKYLLRSYEAINYKDNTLAKALYGEGLNIDNVAKKLNNVDNTVVDAALKYLANRAKLIDSISWVKNDDGTYNIEFIKLDKVQYTEKGISENELSKYIGSENAKVIIDYKLDKDNNIASGKLTTISDDVDTDNRVVKMKDDIYNRNITQEQADKQARIDANEILNDSESYVTRGLKGSTNVSSLTRRKDIAPEIRALMGEYGDPIYNYYASIFKMAGLSASRNYLNELRKTGINNFLFEKGATRPEEASTLIAAEGSETLAPLNGLYTFPELAEALKTAERDKKTIIEAMAGKIRAFKTVYNPATHVKNLIGNMGFAVSNGHWNEAPETFKYIKQMISGNKSKELLDLMDTLNRQGVLNSSVGVGELKAYFDKHTDVDAFLASIYDAANKQTTWYKSGKKAAANLNKIPRAIEKAYAIEDDVFKILGFVNESNRYAQAIYGKRYFDLNADQKADIKNQASEIVKNTYPTFSRVPKFVRGLSKTLFLGNFLSFPVESVRVSYNTLKLAKQEIQSGNPKLKRVGATRLAGTAVYNSLFSTISYYGFQLAGAGLTSMIGFFADDEKEKEMAKAINRYVAPWVKEKDKYVSQFSDGKLIYWDYGSLDSYSYQKAVWNTFWSNMNDEQGFINSTGKAVYEGIKPFLALDLVYDNIISVMNNQDRFGNKIYNPEEGYGNKVMKIGAYMSKQMSPGAVSAAMKVYDYYDKGESDKMKNEIISQFGPRRYEVDLEKAFLNHLYSNPGNEIDAEIGFKNRLANARKIYTDAKKQKLSPSELDNKYQEAISKYKEILQEVGESYRAAIKGGVDSEKLSRMIYNANLGDRRNDADVYSIINNKYDYNDVLYIEK